MNDISRVFLNPFDSVHISLSHLLSFTTDHLVRLQAVDGAGKFATRLAATQVALAAVEAAFTNDETKLGLRKARKLSQRTFRLGLTAAIAKINVAVKAALGERSPAVAECFPGGRAVFARCRAVVLENHLASLITALQAQGALLPGAVASQAVALRADWLAVYQPSAAASGVKAEAEVEVRRARVNLQRELFLNLLALAQNYPGQPEQLGLYMQPSLLTRSKPAAAA